MLKIEWALSSLIKGQEPNSIFGVATVVGDAKVLPSKDTNICYFNSIPESLVQHGGRDEKKGSLRIVEMNTVIIDCHFASSKTNSGNSCFDLGSRPGFQSYKDYSFQFT